MTTKLVAISGHLDVNAPGHFETFHKSLFISAKSIFGESNVRFLGAIGNVGDNRWFEPRVPNSLTSTIPWVPKRFIDLFRNENGRDDIIAYIYEGNLALLFIIGIIARRNPRVYVYFNFFNSYRYNKILQSRIKSYVFRNLMTFAIRGIDEKFYLCGDTKRFAHLLSDKLRVQVHAFPQYATINHNLKSPSSKKFLVNIRGYQSEELLKQLLELKPEMKFLSLDVHGLKNAQIKQAISKYQNVLQLQNQVTEAEYMNSYLNYHRVVFLYDPAFFSMQSSGRLMDAIAVGTEIIVPRDTALEDTMILYGNGTSFDFNDVLSLSDALLNEVEIAKKERDTPTSMLTAQSILKAYENLRTKYIASKVSILQSSVNVFIDELVRATMWILRAAFGIHKRVKFRVFSSIDPSNMSG